LTKNRQNLILNSINPNDQCSRPPVLAKDGTTSHTTSKKLSIPK